MEKLAFYPLPLRVAAARILLRRMPWVSHEKKIKYGAVDRPHYGHCIYQSGLLAKRLGLDKISILEFGVAGGNGLVNIESHIRQLSGRIDIEFEIYGFDTGAGLPEPRDYRDLPYHWRGGFFRMDREALESRLSMAELVLGDVAETCPRFFDEHRPAPVGCVFMDLDYYSSTADALKIFDGASENYLPRVFCYFDDVVGTEVELYNDYTGQPGAIRDFNDSHESKKLSPVRYFNTPPVIPAGWHGQIYSFHDFQHPSYCEFVSDEDQQLRL